ncbi:voltage-gated potassium channel TrkA [Yersinia entomophaga]|uniref:Voltage-gated potassium channel TrkA n=1 Tax=Yersinia entomophaga TaxID=935293 RepID=A0ABM6BQK6_YERET|nr:MULTISPECIES: voltage-gated potassium channel protein [Yersinia]ANI31653.1 voltage-gated potassium channel TrkA [Yersinia entomophaga]OWF86559.1 voltage-gated potassium channel TrkA [Yersinia entomophaga]
MRLFHRIKGRISPTFCLAVMVAINGYLILGPVLSRTLSYVPQTLGSIGTWKETLSMLGLLEIPRFVIGLSLILMAIGLALKARTAWVFTLFLLLAMTLLNFMNGNSDVHITGLSVAIILGLLICWRQFDHQSLASSSLFAIVSISSLLLYAVIGTLYLGAEFSPAVEDLPTAFYFAIVAMSTVGFGDIVPATTHARMFTLSIIIMGITVFAASITAIVGPMISHNIQRIVKGRISHVIRKNHFIIVGTTPLALNVYQGLRDRGELVTLVVATGTTAELPKGADVVTGDPSSVATLKVAGADKAKYIITLCNSDAENVFTLLAAKEVAGPETKTISLVNESQNQPKIKRVNPDMVFSLQLLGSELLVRTLSGETINNELITEMFFGSCVKAN